MEQKPLVEDKVKGSADAGSPVRIQNTQVWPGDPLAPLARVQDIEARGVRKITTGGEGLFLFLSLSFHFPQHAIRNFLFWIEFALRRAPLHSRPLLWPWSYSFPSKSPP